MISIAVPGTPSFPFAKHDHCIVVRDAEGRIAKSFTYPSKHAALRDERRVQSYIDTSIFSTDVLPYRAASIEIVEGRLHALRTVEIAFLVSRGWVNKSEVPDGESWWGPPVVLRFLTIVSRNQNRERYSHSHAVNSELCHGPPATPELQEAQAKYLRAHGWECREALWFSRHGVKAALKSAVLSQKKDDLSYLHVMKEKR